MSGSHELVSYDRIHPLDKRVCTHTHIVRTHTRKMNTHNKLIELMPPCMSHPQIVCLNVRVDAGATCLAERVSLVTYANNDCRKFQ